MGLKISNYYVKDKGITLPTAYAVIGAVTMEENSGIAYMHIQSTRDNALRLKPIDIKPVAFKWDRKSDIAKCIYNACKTVKTVKVWDKNTCAYTTKVVDKQFSEWNDDIV